MKKQDENFKGLKAFKKMNYSKQLIAIVSSIRFKRRLRRFGDESMKNIYKNRMRYAFMTVALVK